MIKYVKFVYYATLRMAWKFIKSWSPKKKKKFCRYTNPIKVFLFRQMMMGVNGVCVLQKVALKISECLSEQPVYAVEQQ